MLEHLRQTLQTLEPRRIDLPHLPEAAVLVPITRAPEPTLILTQRASTLTTHSGEAAFPGGRRDPEDDSLIATALRESHEEIGLEFEHVDVLGPMGALVSRFGLRVTPIVGLVPANLELRPSEAEIAHVFEVPLHFFKDDPRELTHRIDYLGQSWYVPSYTFDGFRIWGLTAIMIAELTNLLYGGRIDLTQPPPAHDIIHLR